MRDVFVLSAARTPMGRFLGSLREVSAVDLGHAASRAALERSGLPGGEVDELIFGSARQAGNGPNLARQVAFRTGIPAKVPAFTVNMACASSLKAIDLAAQAIATGNAEVILAGGTESMSRIPFLLDRARVGYRMGTAEVVDAMHRDGFLCPICEQVMGETAERLAERYSIDRLEQDAYAVESQRRCARSRREGRFARELATVSPPAGLVLTEDETPRDGVTLQSLAKLAPVFKEGGTVHAGNSCGITDGAAALVLASETGVRRATSPPLARVVGCVSVGLDAIEMGLGPVLALQSLQKKTGRSTGDYDLIEINEAFAAQVLACDRELHLDRDRLNVNGGAIALGHPVGATGARIVTTLLHELRRRNGRHGVATLCASGGLGMAVAFEVV